MFGLSCFYCRDFSLWILRTVLYLTERAQVLREAQMLIWDEITMADKAAVEVVDRLLRELTGHEGVPFGGKVVVLAGDWRQLLPVVRRGTKAQILNATVKRSALWDHVTVVRLVQNMRVETLGRHTAEAQELERFSNWLLAVGEDRDRTGVVEIPPEMIVGHEELQDMVDAIWPPGGFCSRL